MHERNLEALFESIDAREQELIASPREAYASALIAATPTLA